MRFEVPTEHSMWGTLQIVKWLESGSGTIHGKNDEFLKIGNMHENMNGKKGSDAEKAF